MTQEFVIGAGHFLFQVVIWDETSNQSFNQYTDTRCITVSCVLELGSYRLALFV